MLTKKILVILAILTAAGCSDDDKVSSDISGERTGDGGIGIDSGDTDGGTNISFEDANEKCSAWCLRVMPLKKCVKYEVEKECMADCARLLQDDNPCRVEWHAAITCQGSHDVVCATVVPTGADKVCETPEVNWLRCTFGGSNEQN